MKKTIWKILRTLRLAAIIQMFYKGILDELGWTRSFYAMQSVDKSGNPIPWCTYAFIRFISTRLTKEMAVFEYGSGNSTLWYASKVKSIVAVEHDMEWISVLEKKILPNARIIAAKLENGDEYAKTASQTSELFDIIIIDGRNRNQCVYQSIRALKKNGVFVFDNSDREKYQESQQFLLNEGFKRIDFSGLCPAVTYNSQTSVFYKTDNCLGI
jgi:hypothetical protein